MSGFPDAGNPENLGGVFSKKPATDRTLSHSVALLAPFTRMAMEGLLIELMLGEEWLDRAVAAVLQRAELQRRCRSAATMSRSARSMRRNGWHPKPRQWEVNGSFIWQR